MTADVEALKHAARDEWTRGDYTRLARLLESAARELVDACAISAGQAVLDVAAGNGNVAVLAGREGAHVVASDLTPAMVELGRERTDAEGLDVQWLIADAEELPFENASFDCVTSAFGAMFAPRHERVAAELFRVARPGATVGLTAWTPGGYQGRLFAITRELLPAPDGLAPASDWGDEEIVRARLGALARRVDVERREVAFEFESPRAMRTFFASVVGPAIALRERLAPELYEKLGERNRRLVAEHNRATDGSVVIDAQYLLVVARKRG